MRESERGEGGFCSPHAGPRRTIAVGWVARGFLVPV